MTFRALALSLLVACHGDTSMGDDDDDDVTTSTERPVCDDTSVTPIEPLYPQVIDPSTGTNVFLTGPEAPRAVLFVFHGSGGDAGQHRQTHPTRVWNTFGAVGFGVIAPESVNRTAKVWSNDTTRSNPDFQNLKAIRAHYISKGLMAEDTPIVSFGFSDGAYFSETFAQLALDAGWPVFAGLPVSGRWNAAPVPAMFTVPENDDLVDSVRSGFETLEANGEDVAMMVTREHPFGRDEMIMTPPYTEEDAAAVFDELVAFGLIAEDGTRLGDLGQLEVLMANYERRSELPGPYRVTPMVRVAWATHRTPSETACEMRDFVLDRLPR